MDIDNIELTISIVLYKKIHNELYDLLQELNNKENLIIYLIDNSESPLLNSNALNGNIHYIYLNKNIGYGRAHNYIFRNLKKRTKLFLILNPDIYINYRSLIELVDFMNKNNDCVMLMPKIISICGKSQNLLRMIPDPLNLFFRRYFSNSKIGRKYANMFEIDDEKINDTIEVPLISGCFMLTRSEIFENINGFDEKFFLYFEDYDLVRRSSMRGKTLFYPHVSAVHGYQRSSLKSFNLLIIHVISMIRYFNKWGWFIDKDRRSRNFLMKRRLVNESNK